MLSTIQFQTAPKESLVNLTDRIREVIKQSGVLEGICVVFVPHTTAGIIINSGMDPNTAADMVAEYHRLIPTRVDFQHQYDTPADASGHVKATLTGSSVNLIITGGDLLLGHSQSVMFFEFDGPRTRKVIVKILSDR